MVAGDRNMIGLDAATVRLAFVVGTVSLAGAHQVVGEFVEFLQARLAV